MKAEEARKISGASTESPSYLQKEFIDNAILKAANKGDFHIWINFYLLSNVRLELMRDEYKISKDQGRYNEILIKISW